MTKADDKIEELLTKHPKLTKVEAINIITEKNERKKKRDWKKQTEVMPKNLEAKQTGRRQMKFNY